ncbi:MAG: hypothetical protein Q9188_000784 [Gyalolechia gomerana]
MVRMVNVSSDAAFVNGPKELDLANPNLESAHGAMACWPYLITMASFFDNKARAAAAAAASSKAAVPKETQNLQPWVEK